MTTGFFAYLMGRSPFGLRLRFSQRLIQFGRRSTKDVATDELSEDATTEGQRTLYGFWAVYVFERLSRDLWPSLCALDVIRE